MSECSFHFWLYLKTLSVMPLSQLILLLISLVHFPDFFLTAERTPMNISLTYQTVTFCIAQIPCEYALVGFTGILLHLIYLRITWFCQARVDGDPSGECIGDPPNREGHLVWWVTSYTSLTLLSLSLLIIRGMCRLSRKNQPWNRYTCRYGTRCLLSKSINFRLFKIPDIGK